MTTYNKNNCDHLPVGQLHAPYGNMTAMPFKFATNSSGVMTDSNKTTAIAATNVIRLGVLPAGMTLLDYIGIISDAFTATTTYDLGFAYCDGEDDTNVPQDADYFASAVALSSLAIARKATTTAPVTLPKDAYLILTNNTAAQDSAGVLDISIIGVINEG